MFDKISKGIKRINAVSFPAALKYAIFFLFIILTSAVSFFHEPWYDEAQAWQIARCASVRDIIFSIPHYEGHPPLWHLLLVPFAKSGLPYNFSLSLVNIIFIAAAVWMLIFKTKLPDVMKVTLPFTYFIFYQYGVISRPYSVMTLAMILCAAFYAGKDEKPFRMVLSLMLLCASSAYGIVYAFLICISWLAEIMSGKKFGAFLKDFVKSRTFYSLIILTVFAFGTFLMILPAKDSLVYLSKNKADISSYVNNYIYTFLILPYDATFGSVIIKDCDIFSENFISASYIPFFFISAAIYVLLFITAKKCGRTSLFLPFALLPLFFGSIFFYSHHIGLFVLYLIFFTCVCFDGKTDIASDEACGHIGTVYSVFFYITVIVQIIWTLMSCVLDINKNYYCGKEIAEYIIDNDLTDAYIIPEGEIGSGGYVFSTSAYAVVTLPYFDRNVYPTYPAGYDTNHGFSAEDLARELHDAEQLGAPDYIIGVLKTKDDGRDNWDHNSSHSISDDYFDNLLGNASYTPAADFESGMIFKGHYIQGYTVILRKDNSDE